MDFFFISSLSQLIYVILQFTIHRANCSLGIRAGWELLTSTLIHIALSKSMTSNDLLAPGFGPSESKASSA